MTEFVFMVFESISWPAALIIAFVLLLLHGIFSTPPSELSLAAIGLYASTQAWLFLPAIIVTTAGNIAGCIVLFHLSRRYSDWITQFIDSSRFRYIKYLINKARKDFHKHGQILLLYGRFLPNLRSIITIPAGFSSMTMSRFLIYSGIGILAWSVAWVSIGFLFGPILLNIIETHMNIAFILLILTILAVFAHRYYFLKSYA